MKAAGCVLFAIGLLAMVSCSGPGAGRVKIEAGIADAVGMKIVLQEMGVHAVRAVDSVLVPATGRFTLRLAVTEEGFWILQAPGHKNLVLLAEPGTVITVTGSMNDFPHGLRVGGPEQTQLLSDFFSRVWPYERKADSLENVLLQRQDSTDFYRLTLRADSLLLSYYEAQRALSARFIRQHPTSLASLLALNYTFGNRPLFTPAQDSVLFLRLDSALRKRIPHNPHVEYHHRRMQDAGYRMQDE